MNARLIAAMASRRAKSAHLPLKRGRHRPEPWLPRLIRMAFEREPGTRHADRLIAWICAFGLVGFVAWRVAELIGGM